MVGQVQLAKKSFDSSRVAEPVFSRTVQLIEVNKTISNLFFFLTKRFFQTKSTKAPNKQLPPSQKLLCAKKTVVFVVFCLLIFVCQLVLLSFAFLCAQHFSKKKINRLEIVLIASIHYTTNVYPPQPTYRASIFTCHHL